MRSGFQVVDLEFFMVEDWEMVLWIFCEFLMFFIVVVYGSVCGLCLKEGNFQWFDEF